MVDPTARRGVPERYTLPPAPRDPTSTARWLALAPAARRDLARRLARPDRVAGTAADRLPLLAALAEARLATGWRLQLAALTFGGLLFMTLWGFGRSSYPAAVEAWRTAGIVAGVLAATVALAVVQRHLRRVREVLALARGTGPTDRGTAGPAA